MSFTLLANSVFLKLLSGTLTGILFRCSVVGCCSAAISGVVLAAGVTVLGVAVSEVAGAF